MDLIKNSKKYVEEATANDFWTLIDFFSKNKDHHMNQEVYGDQTINYNFYRVELLNDYQNHKLFVLKYVETDELFTKRKDLLKFILPFSFNTLFALCTLDDNNEIENIWVHENYRLMGFGKLFVEHFYRDKYRHINVSLPHLTDFWNKMGVKYETTQCHKFYIT